MKEKSETTIVKCERCCKLIQPNAMGVPVDYVWRDGRSPCHECNKKEARNERAEDDDCGIHFLDDEQHG